MKIATSEVSDLCLINLWYMLTGWRIGELINPYDTDYVMHVLYFLSVTHAFWVCSDVHYATFLVSTEYVAAYVHV